jgi:hypothetical protein
LPLTQSEEQSSPQDEMVLYAYGKLRLTRTQLTMDSYTYQTEKIVCVTEKIRKHFGVRFLIGAITIALGIAFFGLAYIVLSNNRQDIERWSSNSAGPLYQEALVSRNDWKPLAIVGSIIVPLGLILMKGAPLRYCVYSVAFLTKALELCEVEFLDENAFHVFDAMLKKLTAGNSL